MTEGGLFAYPRPDVPAGGSVIDERRGATPVDPFDAAYATNVALLRYLARIKFRIPDPESEAVVQDVFLKFARDYAGIRDARRWLVTATCNASRNYWRDRPREAPLPDDIARWTDERAAKEIDVAVDRLMIAAILGKIGERCRRLLWEFHAVGHTADEIAKDRGLKPSYVRLLLHLCKKRAAGIYRSLTKVGS